MIIGYYEQSFFGGGYYYKISKKGNDLKYKFEMCHSAIPNYVPNAEEYISKYDTINFTEAEILLDMDSKLRKTHIQDDILIIELLKHLNNINLDELARKEYNNCDILDGTNWELYIEFKDKKYHIKGYEDQPKDIIKVVEFLYQIGEKYINNSFNGILGLAIGDAMGVPIEFIPRNVLFKNPVTEMKGYGSHNVPKGTWSDDTSMTLATVDAIRSTGTIDYSIIADNFLKWFKEAKYTTNKEVFDIGRTTLRALAKYEENKNNSTECGENSEFSNGNGSLMRILPIAYYCYHQGSKYNAMAENKILEIVKNVSSITHRHEISVIGCYIYTVCAIRLLYGDGKRDAYEYIKNLDYSMFKRENIERFDRLLKSDISKLDMDDIQSSGYIVDTLEATIWVLLNTNSFNQAIIGAINLGDDTDTIGACTGGLAGIIYGSEQINEEWKKSLLKYDYIKELCDSFDEKMKRKF